MSDKNNKCNSYISDMNTNDFELISVEQLKIYDPNSENNNYVLLSNIYQQEKDNIVITNDNDINCINYPFNNICLICNFEFNNPLNFFITSYYKKFSNL
jgi:hypothetical protein